jgi:hypothetical protein
VRTTLAGKERQKYGRNTYPSIPIGRQEKERKQMLVLVSWT